MKKQIKNKSNNLLVVIFFGSSRQPGQPPALDQNSKFDENSKTLPNKILKEDSETDSDGN